MVGLPGGESDVAILKTVITEEKRLGHALPVDSLIALGLLRRERRIDTGRLAGEIQRPEAAARTVLERLVEAGLVVAHGVKKGRTYTLSPVAYEAAGETAGYVRQAGFDAIRQEQMVLQYVEAHGRIARKDVQELCGASEDQARHLLRKLNQDKVLKLVGRGRGAYYVKG